MCPIPSSVNYNRYTVKASCTAGVVLNVLQHFQHILRVHITRSRKDEGKLDLVSGL